jgi:hypothetical protein
MDTTYNHNRALGLAKQVVDDVTLTSGFADGHATTDDDVVAAIFSCNLTKYFTGFPTI